MILIRLIRSILYDLFFYIFTFFYISIFYFPMLLLPRSFTVFIFRTWTKIIMRALRFFVGLSYEVLGQENLDLALQSGPCILALKHQSAFETFISSLLTKRLVIVLKDQLIKIPIYGTYHKKLNSIVIHRNEAVSSLRSLIQDSKIAIRNNFSILIFPEGTRQKPGHTITYKGGVGVIYKALNVPVIPIALNSGVFWGRKSFIKKPGKIIIKILPAIPPGLERTEFMNHLQNIIDTESDQLLWPSETVEKAEQNHSGKPKKYRFLFRLSILCAAFISIFFLVYRPLISHLKNEIISKIHKQGIEANSITFVIRATQLPHININDAKIIFKNDLAISSPNPIQVYPTGLHRFTLVARPLTLYKKGTQVITIENCEACCSMDLAGTIEIDSIETSNIIAIRKQKLENSNPDLFLSTLIGNIHIKNDSLQIILSTPYTINQAPQKDGGKSDSIFHLKFQNNNKKNEILLAIQSTILPDILNFVEEHQLIPAYNLNEIRQAITSVDYADQIDLKSLVISLKNEAGEKKAPTKQ